MKRRQAIIWRYCNLPAPLSSGVRLSQFTQVLFPDKLLVMLVMDWMDARMVLGALIDNMFDKYFPDLKLDSRMHDIVFELYLDFVSDKTGYWVAVKTSCLITAQLNLREKKATPLHTAEAILKWAVEAMDLIAENHKKDNKLIPLSLPDPEMHRVFQSSGDFSEVAE
jgi:hypothetical protein